MLRVPLTRLPAPLPALVQPLTKNGALDEPTALCIITVLDSVAQAYLRGPSGQEEFDALDQTAWLLAEFVLTPSVSKSFNALPSELQELLFLRCCVALALMHPNARLVDQKLLSDVISHSDERRSRQAIRCLPLLLVRSGVATFGLLIPLIKYPPHPTHPPHPPSHSPPRSATGRRESSICVALLETYELLMRFAAESAFKREGESHVSGLVQTQHGFTPLAALPTSFLCTPPAPSASPPPPLPSTRRLCPRAVGRFPLAFPSHAPGLGQPH